jgi:predicted ATPase/DNA-binding SARP family transcriptional activator
MSTLTLHLLGAPYIEHNDALVKFSRHKCLALFAYLVVTRTGHTRDALATLLWPELTQQRAHAALRRTLVALTHGIGKGWLTFADDRIAVPAQPNLWVDGWRFQELKTHTAAHAHLPFDLCDECLAALTEATDLWHDDFMAGFSLRDAPLFDTWQTFQVESFRRECSTALEDLAQAYAGRGQYEQAIEYGRRGLALDPLHEGMHRLLMRLYAWAGDQGAALRQAQECAELLAAEVGASPQPETLELADSIRTGHLPAWTGNVRSCHADLPRADTPFFGREAELAHITACLSDPACRLLTVVGAGGAGKTRLAVKAAASQQAQFADGVHFASLYDVTSPGGVADTILRTLALHPPSGLPVHARLLDFLRSRRMLLILDSFEHLTQGVGLLLELMAAAPGLKLLVTSRARLNLRDEWLAPIAGLELPPAGIRESARQLEDDPAPVTLPPWAVLERFSSIQLFLYGVRRLRPGFQPSPGDAADIVGICQLLDGLPLGIELAASWTQVLSFADILQGMERSLDFLTASMCDLPERHRSLRAVFDHSWRLLTPHHRSVLRQLAVFDSCFTPSAAAAVTGATLADLAELVNHSWLRVDPMGRLDLPGQSRKYCAEKLDAEHACECGESADCVHGRLSATYSLL